TDLVMPGMRGNQLVAEVHRSFPEIPVVVITAFGSVPDALELTRAGAADYLTKPFRTSELLTSLRRVLSQSLSRRTHARALRRMEENLGGIMGESPAMLGLLERIGRVANSPAPVLITGETGSGKELVARAVHEASGRDPFLPVNCGALPENLIESELFGHVQGAFSGADRDKIGLFEAASGGTLFLDEIGELPPALQPKLLRALESGEIRPVGGTETRTIDVRVLAASHRDLEVAVEDGDFREDLYWRLHVLHLEVPPLRARPADIPLLAQIALNRLSSREKRRELRVDESTLVLLKQHPWPGNVRQLFNVLEQAAAFGTGSRILPEHLPPEFLRGKDGAAPRDAPDDSNRTLAEVERAHILRVLEASGGNKALAARKLGIPRRTLYRRLDAYGLDARGGDADGGDVPGQAG
ncbi:MAG: sigma-54-dependent Fis family transcriptional regulator, partial [Gemmatimonadales bacterium]